MISEFIVDFKSFTLDLLIKYLWIIYLLVGLTVLFYVTKIIIKFRRRIFLALFYKYTLKTTIKCVVIQTRCLSDEVYHVLEMLANKQQRFIIREKNNDILVLNDEVCLTCFYNYVFKLSLIYYGREYVDTIKGNLSNVLKEITGSKEN